MSAHVLKNENFLSDLTATRTFPEHNVPIRSRNWMCMCVCVCVIFHFDARLSIPLLPFASFEIAFQAINICIDPSTYNESS